ncbi:MAG: hypothetical protein JSU77_03340 [Fidelibacterota bacterium]|nr:MAG: hypothetical protein JSU77_03340 [Candidatus Neomarinimicrobiota bacterium]
MRSRVPIALIRAAFIAITIPVGVHAAWTFEAFLGSAWSVPSPLSIHQYGEERLHFTARYATKPLVESPYYAWRIAKWSGEQAWEFELVHHKLYLENPPDEVQHFEVSHGYNLITINRVWVRRGFIWRGGVGVVATHPETKIRGKKLPWGDGLNGFYVSGPTIQLAIGRKFPLRGGLFAVVEGKWTASYATIPVRDGNAYVPNMALHWLIGLGYDF